MRKPEIRFGTFERPIGTPVYADQYWFAVASSVRLDGEAPIWTDLGEYMDVIAARVERAAPAVVSADWVREHAPLGLGISRRFKSRLNPLDLPLVAMGVEGDATEVAYPFLVREHNDRVMCGFSMAGPAPSIRDGIVVEMGARLLWAAEGGFLGPRTNR
jgi:hypothetical protein